LIPTPGQTEQEYLARYMEQQEFFLFAEQKSFNLDQAISRLEKFMPDLQPGDSSDLLDGAIQGLYSLVGEKKM